MELTELSFDSEPGTYELQAEDGRVYEVCIPEEVSAPGTLLMSREAGAADSQEGRELLSLLDLTAVVGQLLSFSLDVGDEGMREARAAKAVSITRVS